MGRTANSLERTRWPLDPEPRPARRKDSGFSRRRFCKTSSRAQLSLRNVAPRNRATCDLPFRTDRDGLEHAPVAVPVAPTSLARLSAGTGLYSLITRGFNSAFPVIGLIKLARCKKLHYAGQVAIGGCPPHPLTVTANFGTCKWLAAREPISIFNTRKEGQEHENV